jgi:hypothetical protein
LRKAIVVSVFFVIFAKRHGRREFAGSGKVRKPCSAMRAQGVELGQRDDTKQEPHKLHIEPIN